MAKPHPHSNPMKFSLGKKGLIEFMFSKFAFLVFGIIITASFLYFLSAQKNMQQFDEVARTSEALSGIMAMASASPFNFSVLYRPDINATLNFTENFFDITANQKTVRHALTFPINTTGIVAMDKCINITKTHVTEVSECP